MLTNLVLDFDIVEKQGGKVKVRRALPRSHHHLKAPTFKDFPRISVNVIETRPFFLPHLLFRFL
jgi:hypothetical protein